MAHSFEDRALPENPTDLDTDSAVFICMVSMWSSNATCTTRQFARAGFHHKGSPLKESHWITG